MGEIQGIAEITGIPAAFIQAFQVTPEVQSLKGPMMFYFQSRGMALPTDKEVMQGAPNFLKYFFNQGVGCTGIIARDGRDGSVYHARNFDFTYTNYTQPLVYNAIFTRAGKEVFTAQMVAPFQGVITGIKKGPDGFSYAIHTRFTNESYKSMADDTFGHPFFGLDLPPLTWIGRKTMEEAQNYNDAVETFSTVPLPAPTISVVSGVRKGVILTRAPDRLVRRLDLGNNPFIVGTNYDSDELEAWLDDTAAIGSSNISRRLNAENMLKGHKVVTPELLQTVLSDERVMATTTVFQAIINIEKGIYNSTLPRCIKCP
jgi:hypothetical protein